MSHSHKHKHEREHALQRELEAQRQRERELQRELELERQKAEVYQVQNRTGEEILCVSAPSPVTVGLLGTKLTLELPCLRLTAQDTLSETQTSQIQGIITSLLKLLGIVFPTHEQDTNSKENTLMEE